MERKISEMILSKNGNKASLEKILGSADLFRDGYLDSLASVAVVHDLEREFSVKIGPFLITKANLSSVASIKKLVEQRLKAS